MDLLYIALMVSIIFGPSFLLAVYYENKYKLDGKAYCIFFGVLTVVWLLITFISTKPKKGRRSNV